MSLQRAGTLLRGVLSRSALIACGMALAASARATDLLDLYRLALAADPVYLTARATAEGGREVLPQALAGLLPQVSANYSRSRNSTDQSTQGFIPGTINSRRLDYPAIASSISLRQPVIRLANVAGYQSAQAQVVAVEAVLAHELQSVALRVAGAYFDTLVARSKVAVVVAQREAYRGQLSAADRAMANGFGTRTDIDDAKARFDVASAQEIEARHNLRVAERSLSGIVNRRIRADALSDIDAARLKLELPDPPDVDSWMSHAESNNPQLQALRASVQTAEREVDKNRAGHLPTLDLAMSRSNNDSDTNTSIGSKYLTTSVGLQLNIPLYAGGQIDSVVRQAQANLDKARQQHEAGKRQIETEVEKEFGAVEAGVARIRALEQAERSAEQAVLSSRKGVDAGTRNSVDVLNALQQFAATRQELIQARYTYAFDQLKLAAAAGSLGESGVATINAWLSR